MHLPQGDQRAFTSAAGCEVSRLRFFPSAPTIQMSVRPRFASRSVWRRVKTSHWPSGDTWVSEILSMASMSWTERGCVAAGGA